MEPAILAIEHLLLKLRVLNRVLRTAVERQRKAAERFARPGLSTLCITDEHVEALLSEVEALSVFPVDEKTNSDSVMNPDELAMEEELRVCAKARGYQLPFDALMHSSALTHYEEMAVLTCTAPEVERGYGRIYGYVLDDLNRQQPSVELLCLLAANSSRERLRLRRALGRFGRLRRSGMLQAVREAASETKQEVRLAPVLLDFLLGAPGDATSLFRDHAEVSLGPQVGPQVQLPAEINQETVTRLGQAIKEGRVSLVGVWGARHSGREELLFALAAAAHRPLRRFSAITGQTNAEISHSVWQTIQMASALGAIAVVETDGVQGLEHESARDALTEALIGSKVPVFLTGAHTWRPVRLLESRSYIEFELAAPTFQARKAMWSRTLPEVVESQVSNLAARFRLSGSEMRAAARLARTSAELNSNGHRVELIKDLETACATVTRKRSDHFARLVKPKRSAEDLVLPEDVHQQVIEIASFFRATSVVDEEWGFGRITAGGGIKVLFTGEPGTGKTLAAEVIAGIIGLPLLKVDLARVVSKWVGETEKNLDTVFHEAEESHSVLFFDEADSLFGKRGEVQHGTDRYANLEIGFLLQRLEDYFGLVILASNLKDQIDTAFTRRFHVIVHFPLPRPAERRRIWQLAFPPDAPTESKVDLDMLMQLDMTGAAIVSAARTAALLAASDGRQMITMDHVVTGIARQFRREARILTPNVMGPYAALLKGPL